MTRTLVENLRDVTISNFELADSLGKSGYKEGCHVCWDALRIALADAIEREYIPKPRFEGGEPVQIGDEVFVPCSGGDFAGEVCEIAFDGEVYTLMNTDGDIVHFAHWESVGRTEPEPEIDVLDADGVPIKPGDTVYGITYRTRRPKVKSVHARGRERPYVVYENGEWDYAWSVSHKLRDSLERIEEDALVDTCVYFGHDESTCDGCCMKGNETPCEVEKALDLLRRQRELLVRK